MLLLFDFDHKQQDLSIINMHSHPHGRGLRCNSGFSKTCSTARFVQEFLTFREIKKCFGCSHCSWWIPYKVLKSILLRKKNRFLITYNKFRLMSGWSWQCYKKSAALFNFVWLFLYNFRDRFIIRWDWFTPWRSRETLNLAWIPSEQKQPWLSLQFSVDEGTNCHEEKQRK